MRVKCIDNGITLSLTIGKEYEVLQDIREVDGLWYEVENDDKAIQQYKAIRFEIIEEPTQIIDLNGIQTEPFTNEQKKVIAVEKDIKKCEIYALLLEDFKKANELQRIGIIEIFEELGYSNSDTVKLIRTLIDEL